MAGPRATPIVVSAAAITAAVIVASWRSGATSSSTGRNEKLRRRMYWVLSLTGGTLKLCNVRIPVALLSVKGDEKIEADEEGLVDCSVAMQGGKVTQIEIVSASTSNTSTLRSIDCQNSILLPCFTDAHTHMVKTHTVARNRNMSGTINEALEVETYDQPRWKLPGDTVRRMEFSVKSAIHHGTRAIRTHLDGTSSEDPEVAAAVYEAFDFIREKYKSVLIVQGVANLFLPLWTTPMAKPFADEAKSHANVVLGAYVPPSFKGPVVDAEIVSQLDALFGHAIRLDMDVDMHIDETNEPKSCALLSLCESLGKAREAGYTGRVVLGHCCALSLQPKPIQERVVSLLARHKAFVVVNPFTNLGLQDRQGTAPPMGAHVPANVPRTPQWRGLSLIQELKAAGVVVAGASDNVRDHWYPFGDYDLLSVWLQAQGMGHLETAPSEGFWADLVTSAAAEAMGVPFGRFVDGMDADIILFPSARRMSELFARVAQADRLVLRRGRVQQTRLPEFSDLDDLVEVKTERPVQK